MATIRRNQLKEKLAQGQVTVTISGNLNSEMVDFLGPLGFDGIWIECEHGGVTRD